MMSLLSYSQRILKESDFPVKIVYQDSERVLITLNQVDSLNLAFANLEECEEYEDSLESTIVKYKALIETGKEVEYSLKGVILQKDRILEESDALTKVLTDDNNKKKKRLKLFKHSTQVLGGAVFVLLLVLLI
jgi:hypothetical protein